MKVIAVHLNYRSRADQRGRRPATPSYFLKPASSLAESGGVLERPAGTELLAFEGEIALVIGTSARRVPVERAWSHVASVTAANDFGLYDLRAADRGSNLRAKGGDGFTPIGEFLPAADLDPAALRVRTWVNGVLRQEDTSADLLFPFAQLIADLSEHLTLEPGDILLTGTPAGSSVVEPGDVVEVEVDQPGGPSTGRLVTTITQGQIPFSGNGSRPQVSAKDRAEAWGEPTGLSERLRSALQQVPVAALCAELRRRGLNNVVIDGVRPLTPGAKLVGTARTLRFLPGREDLFRQHGGGHNAQKRIFDSVGADEVIVIEARGDRTAGTLGDVLALRARHRGAAGVVTDGGVRDAEAVAATGLPIFAAGPHPAVLGRRHVPWETDVAIACGGAAVLPGDVLVGDSDGVLVIPVELAEEVAAAALAQERQDSWVAGLISRGAPIEGLFPPDERWRARYEEWTNR